MSKNKLPREVFLPDVPTYTDEIVFGNLGFPVGFDNERILVNLRAFERVQAVAGLGNISIIGHRGENQPFEAQITSVDRSGAATLGAAGKRHKKPLGHGNVAFPTTSSFFDNPSAVIKVNFTELEAQIDEADKYAKGVFDPTAQSERINTGVKEGLREASYHANFDREKAIQALQYYGSMNMLGLGTGHGPLVSIGVSLVAGPVATHLGIAKGASMKEDPNIKEALQRFRSSLFAGCAPDKYIAARGLIASHKFIKSRK
jgi:hypothetical protein